MTKIVVVDSLAPDQATLRRAVAILKEGGVVAYPTETFYALGVDAFNLEALEKLVKLKSRSGDKAISLIISDLTALGSLVSSVPVPARQLMEKFWPGPLTLVLPGISGLPPPITNEARGVALRISSHPVARELASIIQGPISATSANIAGEAPPTTGAQVYSAFGEGLDLVLDAGETEGGKPSTVLDFTADKPRVLREGKIKTASLLAVLSR